LLVLFMDSPRWYIIIIVVVIVVGISFGGVFLAPGEDSSGCYFWQDCWETCKEVCGVIVCIALGPAGCQQRTPYLPIEADPLPETDYDSECCDFAWAINYGGEGACIDLCEATEDCWDDAYEECGELMQSAVDKCEGFGLVCAPVIVP
jgi:hypothetical protein